MSHEVSSDFEEARVSPRRFACAPAGLEFLTTAPIQLSVAVGIRRPPGAVFAALAHEPAAWGGFFPGFDGTGRWLTPAPHHPGSRYTKRLLGIGIEASVLLWDEANRFAVRIERASAPLFRAWVEDYRMQSDGRGGTVLRVAIGAHPRLPVPLARSVLPRALSRVLVRAGRNLERTASPAANAG